MFWASVSIFVNPKFRKSVLTGGTSSEFRLGREIREKAEGTIFFEFFFSLPISATTRLIRVEIISHYLARRLIRSGVLAMVFDSCTRSALCAPRSVVRAGARSLNLVRLMTSGEVPSLLAISPGSTNHRSYAATREIGRVLLINGADERPEGAKLGGAGANSLRSYSIHRSRN